jgi:CHAD domain-containing protein
LSKGQQSDRFVRQSFRQAPDYALLGQAQFSILFVAMNESSTQISSGRAFRTKTGRSCPVKGSLQTETGNPAQLRRASVKSLQFRVDESVRDGLARVSEELIERALARIDCAGKNRSEDLHQVRVTIKRLRALLRLVRPIVSDAFCDRENRRLKATADRLAFFRDTTVSRQTLATLARRFADQRSEEAFELVLARFVEQSPDPRRFSVRREQALRLVASSLAEAKQSFENMLVPAEDWQVLGPGLQKVYGRARNCMMRALTYTTPETFHEWRKQVKYLYYQLQMFGSISPKRIEAMVGRLHKLEDRLGEDHDLAVLERLLCDGREKYGGKRAVKCVVTCLTRQSRKLRRETAAVGKEIFREKPRKFVDKLAKQWSVWRESAYSTVRMG